MNPIKVPATIVDIERYGTGTYLLRMKPAKSVPGFKAGQFMHLTIDDYDPAGGFWPESRVFSIASSYGETFVEIIYSVKGAYTRRMQQELRVGSNIWLKLPYGNFVITNAGSAGKSIVLIAGGTGISPFLPYLASIESGVSNGVSVALHYGVRDNGMAIKSALLKKLAISGLVDLTYYVQESVPEPIDGALNIHGSLEIDGIFKKTKSEEAPVFFLSGPPGMIQSFRARLAERGVSDECIKIDEWE